jgi:hypothetical protein
MVSDVRPWCTRFAAASVDGRKDMSYETPNAHTEGSGLLTPAPLDRRGGASLREPHLEQAIADRPARFGFNRGP